MKTRNQVYRNINLQNTTKLEVIPILQWRDYQFTKMTIFKTNEKKTEIRMYLLTLCDSNFECGGNSLLAVRPHRLIVLLAFCTHSVSNRAEYSE